MLTAQFVGIFFSVFTLVVSESIGRPPSFDLTPPKLVVFKENDSVLLECSASGDPAVKCSWRKDGVNFDTKAANVRLVNETSLLISSLTLSSEGFYQCIAENKYGIAVSNSSRLQMAALVAVGQTHLTAQLEATEGQSFVIPASTFKVIPNSRTSRNYVWKKQTGNLDKATENIIPDNRTQIADNGDLYFAYVLPSDGLDGKLYISAITNQHLSETIEGNNTRLNVRNNSNGVEEFIPSLAFSSVSASPALEGENVTLRCFFYGKPEPSIAWFRGGGTLPGGRFILSNHNTELTLVNVIRSDEADYYCMGMNNKGSSTMQRVSLRVEASPMFKNSTDGPQEVSVTEKDKVTFPCSAISMPEPNNILWLYNGEVLQEDKPRERFTISADRKSLTIDQVCRQCKGPNGQMTSDTGVIQCNVSNIHGYALGTGFLNVITLKQAAVSNSGPDERRVPFEFAFVFILSTAILISF